MRTLCPFATSAFVNVARYAVSAAKGRAAAACQPDLPSFSSRCLGISTQSSSSAAMNCANVPRPLVCFAPPSIPYSSLPSGPSGDESHPDAGHTTTDLPCKRCDVGETTTPAPSAPRIAPVGVLQARHQRPPSLSVEASRIPNCMPG